MSLFWNEDRFHRLAVRVREIEDFVVDGELKKRISADVLNQMQERETFPQRQETQRTNALRAEYV